MNLSDRQGGRILTTHVIGYVCRWSRYKGNSYKVVSRCQRTQTDATKTQDFDKDSDKDGNFDKDEDFEDMVP